jgi:hypothetical protein
MAAATKTLASSGLCVAVLNYDDLTLLASGVTVANISGTEAVQFSITVSGQTFSRTIGIGQSGVITFPVAIAVTLGLAGNGLPNLLLSGLQSFSIGSG